MTQSDLIKTTEFSSFHTYIGLDMKIEIYGRSYNTHLRGIKNNEYLIVDTPIKDGSYLNLHKDEQCIVRYIYEGEVFGFATYVIKNFIEPIRILVLEYPQSIESKSLRNSKRVEAFIPLKIAYNAGSEVREEKGFILDISKDGCKIYFKGSINFELDQDIKLSFTLISSERIQNLQCQIKYIKKEREENSNDLICYLGVKFNDSNESNLTKVMDYLRLYMDIM